MPAEVVLWSEDDLADLLDRGLDGFGPFDVATVCELARSLDPAGRRSEAAGPHWPWAANTTAELMTLARAGERGGVWELVLRAFPHLQPGFDPVPVEHLRRAVAVRGLDERERASVTMWAARLLVPDGGNADLLARHRAGDHEAGRALVARLTSASARRRPAGATGAGPIDGAVVRSPR